MRILVMLIVTLSLAGCAAWERVEKAHTKGPGDAYTVDLPVGWVRSTLAGVSGGSLTQLRGDPVLVTRDGPRLQVIALSRDDGDKAFPKLKKGASEDLLPSELAELYVADLKARGGEMAVLKVLDNRPVRISGQPGFRVHLQYRNTRGLVLEQVTCGLLYRKKFYLVSYQAPALHYFQKTLPDYEAVVASFRLI